MNVRRGLFRLWVVLTGLWVVIVGLVLGGEIANPYLSRVAYSGTQAEGFVLKPLDPYGLVGDERYDEISFPNNVYWYAPKGLDDQQLEDLAAAVQRKFVEPRSAEIREKRWANFVTALAVVFVPCLSVLLVGWALLWAFSGFRRTGA